MDIIIYDQMINITSKIIPNEKELGSTHTYTPFVTVIALSNIEEFSFSVVFIIWLYNNIHIIISLFYLFPLY